MNDDEPDLGRVSWIMTFLLVFLLFLLLGG